MKLAVVALFSFGLVGCGPTASAARCDKVEAIVEPSEGHTLNPASVTFVHHPPTSGRHAPDAPAAGVHTTSILEAVQVAALESGWVLLQYGHQATASDRRVLRRLAGPTVVVAPAVRIDGNRNVAFTAWRHRQLCDHPRNGDVAQFVERFAGKPVI